MNWQRVLKIKGRLKSNEPINRHTTFKIGGCADLFIEPRDIRDLKLLLRQAKIYKLPFRIIGAGSNILAGDSPIKGIVARLSSPFFKQVSFKNGRLQAASGVALSSLLKEAATRSLCGLEFLAGIPGSLGGALFMNAGAWGSSILDSVEKVKVLDYNNKVKILSRSQIPFQYRRSGLEKYIILAAYFRLSKGKRQEINQQIRHYLKLRRNTQGVGLPNAGCIFKNPKADFAGRLIDSCGLKGRRVGGACISKRHANFILNCSGARADDVLNLMALVRKRVKEKFGIVLEPEIKIWQ